MKILNSIILFLIIFVGLSNDVTNAQCSPTLREIYDFEVGDQFYYRETYQKDDVDGSSYTYKYENFEIISKKSVGDTLRYIRLSDNNALDTIVIIDSTFHSLNRCYYIPDSTLPHCGNYWSLDKDYLRIYRVNDSNENSYKLFGTKEFGEIYSRDSLGYHNFKLDDFKAYSRDCYSIYQEGIGVLSRGTFTFESGLFYDLYQHIRGNDTLHITLSSPNQEKVTPSIILYPNPVQNSCRIQCPFSIQEVLVKDVTGKFQDISSVSNTQTEWITNTSNLIPGVYYLTIKTEHGSFIKKLLKY